MGVLLFICASVGTAGAPQAAGAGPVQPTSIPSAYFKSQRYLAAGAGPVQPTSIPSARFKSQRFLAAGAGLAQPKSGAPAEIVLTSIGLHDGMVLESRQNSGVGGAAISNRTGIGALRIGDFPENTQVKLVVSFDTSAIPPGADLNGAKLRLRRGGQVGLDPFNDLGPCLVDAHAGGLGGSTALERVDFEATATASAVATLLSATPASLGWSEADLDARGLAAIDRTGTTQFRVYCTISTNGNSSEDTIGYYSGENANPDNRPQLVVSYIEGNGHSIARQWNEELLQAIRGDFARPTVHARNLYHNSVAMWDAWAAYDGKAGQVLHYEKAVAADVAAARAEAISYAAYRLLSWRFAASPGAANTQLSIDAKMDALGYDRGFTSTAGNSPAALGNRIAQTIINYGLTDGANEANGFKNRWYTPVNPPLVPGLPGNPDLVDPNRYQPLALEFFIDQSGNTVPGGFPEFLSPEWGQVKPFALSENDRTVYHRDGFDYWVYHDQDPPPYAGTEGYKTGFEQVVKWSGYLDPSDGVMIDISPAARGNNPLGTNNGTGYALNPVAGQPYQPQEVPAGDYYRVLAEFWADGPESETPPGHWFSIANYVADHPLFEKRLGGVGSILDDLEWDVKAYLALGGAMHDTAITAWGVKGWYDYIRPISAIRYMFGLGQSSDPSAASYHPDGVNLYPGQIELVTQQTAAPGGIHAHLAGDNGENIGKIAIHAWRGPAYIQDPETDMAGVGWILAENWWPYQRPSFVTPPFAGFVSGHSTFSRAAAEVMTLLTGDEFFPGGMGTFEAPQNEFLVFEEGPSVNVTLQWATYYDAADESSLSRIYGGIHPTADDIPGRLMGHVIGPNAFHHAKRLFSGDLGLPPSVTITVPLGGATFAPGASIVFSASASDADGLDLTSGLQWTSSLDGPIGVGGSFSLSTLSLGMHTITAQATDGRGQMGTDAITIAVGNQMPTVSILSPADDTRVDEGTPVELAARADDFEDGDLSGSVDWISNVDGPLGSGALLSVTTLSPGRHTITAEVADSGGLVASASVSVTIFGLGPTTEVVLTSSASLDGYVVESAKGSGVGGAAISNRTGSGALRIGDFQGDTQVKLVVSFDTSAIPPGATVIAATLRLRRGGQLGQSPFQALGPCLVDVHESGFGGDADLVPADFEAGATAAGVATLSEPLANGDWSSAVLNAAGLAAVTGGGTVQFRTACAIAHNGNNLQDTMGYFAGDDAEPSNRPQLVLSLNEGNQAPTVSIAAPADGYQVPEGTTIDFAATAADAEDGELTSSIVWRSSLDGIIGNGGAFSTASLSEGAHLISAEVLDSAGLPGGASVTVTVGVGLTPAFSDATAAAGLTGVSAIGVAAGDYNNDGCVDLAFSSNSVRSVFLFRNNCDGTFTDVSNLANIGTTTGQGLGLAWGDYDNDGYLDLYVAMSNATPNQLYRNQGDGTFISVAAAAGVASTRGGAGVVWVDYDADGDLDLHVSNRFLTDKSDILYQNNGDGTFTDVAAVTGIAGASTRSTFMGAWADFDENLTPDLYLAVDFGNDVFYRNYGHGIMIDETAAAGLTETPQHAMGIAVGDPNGDGCLDVFVTNNNRSVDPPNQGPRPSFLYRNNCDGTFTSIGEEVGILARNVIEWGTSFVDFDNDGHEDLSIVAGGIVAVGNIGEPNVLYLNVSTAPGEFSLLDVTEATGTADGGRAQGAIWVDYDNDGDMDWVVANDSSVRLFRNAGPTGNYLKIKLRGTVSNSYGVGARVEVTANGRMMVRYLRAGLSYASAEELMAHFGLGDASSVDQITVKWPSGVVDTLTGPINANTALLVEEGHYQ